MVYAFRSHSHSTAAASPKQQFWTTLKVPRGFQNCKLPKTLSASCKAPIYMNKNSFQKPEPLQNSKIVFQLYKKPRTTPTKSIWETQKNKPSFPHQKKNTRHSPLRGPKAVRRFAALGFSAKPRSWRRSRSSGEAAGIFFSFCLTGSEFKISFFWGGLQKGSGVEGYRSLLFLFWETVMCFRMNFYFDPY